MFKFFILIFLTFVSVQSLSKSFNSFEDAFEYEISQYDFDANYKNDLKNFKDFKIKYNKKYGTNGEEEKRFNAFRINLLKIKLMNFFEKGTAVYGINPFADLEEQEFKKRYGLLMNKMHDSMEFSEPEFDRNAELSTSVDWREKGAVTEVKNQGECNSSWSFSAIGAVESQTKIVNGKLLNLSAQQLVDCDFKNLGCFEGSLEVAYQYMVKSDGLKVEEDYPYTGKNEYCDKKKGSPVVQVEKYVKLNKDEDEIANYVFQKGPVSIRINSKAMQFYKGGFSNPESNCEPENLDHDVLIVGFGEKPETGKYPIKYWIIKNSWGQEFGVDGYYYLVRGRNNCGVRENVIAPVIKKTKVKMNLCKKPEF